jgi:predicted phage tail protein
MNKELVEINLHGVLGKQVGKQTWKLDVKSVSESCHAINILTKNKFYSQLWENEKSSIKYEVLINKNPCLFAEKPDVNNPESILNSELVMNYPNLKTIDIVPVIEGAEDIGLIIAGVILIAASFWSFGLTAGIGLTLLKGALVFGGLGLIAAGIINLLSSPPKLEDFKGASKRGSYLFDGPENVVGEGGPVPLVYGQLLVGSQTIAATYSITNQDAGQLLTT